MLAAGKGGTATGRSAEAQELFDKLQSVGVELPDVFLVLENEGVEKSQTSWHELPNATQIELNAAIGTQQSAALISLGATVDDRAARGPTPTGLTCGECRTPVRFPNSRPVPGATYHGVKRTFE